MVWAHLLPDLIPPAALRGGVAVVIDVLRASTMIVHALANGCEAVIPCAEIDDAQRLAASLPAGSALLAGERRGLPIDGFDLANSPAQCTREVCEGKTLVMTTTNGTRAILASLEAELVLVGSFVNFAATVQRLLVETRPLHLVCAGTNGEISYEDALLAGAFAARFADLERPLGNDQAEIARGLWLHVEEASWQRGDGPQQPDDPPPLARYLKRGAGGRRVCELGLEADLIDAATLNRPGHHLTVELLRGDPPRLAAAR